MTCCAGAHLNPAITLTMVITGRLRAIELPFYWLAQYIGAFSGAACVYGVYFGKVLPVREDSYWQFKNIL